MLGYFFFFKINKREATLILYSRVSCITKNKEIHDEIYFYFLDCNINWKEQKTSCGQCVRNIIHDSLLVDGIFCRFHTHW